MKITLQYWSPKNEWKTNNGFTYLDTNSVIKETLVLEGTKEEIFARFYHLNNELRYCNGNYYTFEDKELNKEYRGEFFNKYHTIDHYYGNGVVD